MTREQQQLEITMANTLAFNVSNERNQLGRITKDESIARLNYLFSFLLDHSYWLSPCQINKIRNHITSSCDSC